MAGVFFHRKWGNVVLLEYYSVEISKIRYSWGFNLIKMLKEGKARVLIFLRC